MRSCGIVAGALVALVLAACGGASTGSAGAGQSTTTSASASRASFPVAVTARFPARQHLAEPTRLVVAVRNAGHRALPDVAVTVCNLSCAPSSRSDQGTSAQAFGHDINSAPNTADPSRPLWIIDHAPGDCHFHCDRPGGQAGSAVTASSNTWALGRLAPGQTARFAWSVTAISAGRHIVAWQVAGDLTGAARATTSGGAIPHGSFTVRVSRRPPSYHVTPSGRVVTIRP